MLALKAMMVMAERSTTILSNNAHSIAHITDSAHLHAKRTLLTVPPSLRFAGLKLLKHLFRLRGNGI